MSSDTLHRTEVDGIPVVWVAGQRTLRASLWFRAGMADATLPTHGWLHLLEHLALHGRESIRAPINGHVSLLHTSFDVEGEPDDVVAFLRDVCEWLSYPRFADLGHERRVLRAEGTGRAIGSVGTHLVWKYGAQGPGLAGYDELGLHTAHSDGLRRLAAEVFTRGNAVLALTGPPPAGLTLPLPAGVRRPTPQARPCDYVAPAGFVGRPGAIAVSATLPRSTAATALARAVQRALQHELRHRAGVGYSAWAAYEVVDAGHALVASGIDVLPEALPTVVAGTTAALRRLRDHGPDPVELQEDIEREVGRISSEPIEHWEPFLAARDELLGRPVLSTDALVAELRSVTAADIQASAAAMWNDLLLSADPDSPADPQLTWLHAPPHADAIEGQRFHPAGGPVVKGVLTVGPSAARIEGEQLASTAAYNDLAALIAFPDGGRCLIRRDGYQVVVEPQLWRGGQEAVAIIDSSVPRSLRVAMPERTAEEIPHNQVSIGRRLRYVSKRAAKVAGLAGAIVFGVVVVVAVGDGQVIAFYSVILGGAACLFVYQKWKGRAR